MQKISIGIVRETKSPPDKRVPLTPAQCSSLLAKYPHLDIRVQPSGFRCFSDDEYEAGGLALAEDLSSCDVLMGVKEVKRDALIDRKTYLFFSHTAKKQAYNRGLLQEVVRKGIRLLDYEYLTGADGMRVVAFGRWAGVVGAYNGLLGFGRLSGVYSLKPANECFDLQELYQELRKIEAGKLRILVTGGGRVAGGAQEILERAGIRRVEPDLFLKEEFEEAVYTRIDPWHYTRRKDGSGFDFAHFMEHPEMYENSIAPYAERTHLFMACHFWDPRSPRMLSREALAGGKVPISLIADISCDINGPIASTIRASTIASPFYGYDPVSGRETAAFKEGRITVMAVDNLPGELPRDASADFGSALMEHVIPELLGIRQTGMLERASITAGGALTPLYAYLEDYLAGRE
ncbi:MAG: NAD(P)-dependent oxidoreductase [Bacteroidales bacterium]|nr:NAD(P)-dependent oxidoreductase [Bacteroidales bacterium]